VLVPGLQCSNQVDCKILLLDRMELFQTEVALLIADVDIFWEMLRHILGNHASDFGVLKAPRCSPLIRVAVLRDAQFLEPVQKRVRVCVHNLLLDPAI